MTIPSDSAEGLRLRAKREIKTNFLGLLSIRSRLWTVGLAFACYAAIHHNAFTLVADTYGYFQPRELNWLDHLVALLFVVTPILFVSLGNQPAACAFWIYYCFVYISSGIAGVAMFESLSEYVSFMSFMAAGGAVFYGVASLRVPGIAGRIRARNLDFAMMLGAIVLVMYAWTLSGFSLRFDLSDVYGRRLDVREVGGITGYLIAPLRLLLPLIAIYAFYVRRSLLWGSIAGLSGLALFSFDGTKSSLFIPLLLWLILSALRRNFVLQILLIAIIAINLIAQLEYHLYGSTLLTQFGIRRAFIVPGMLASIYWDYAPQAMNLQMITYEIGEEFFGNPEINANANFLMWGLVWGGFLGGMLMAILAGLVVAFLRPFPGPNYPWLGSLMAAGFMLLWAEQFLHTSLLSSGVVLIILLAIILKHLPQGFPGLRPRVMKSDIKI